MCVCVYYIYIYLCVSFFINMASFNKWNISISQAARISLASSELLLSASNSLNMRHLRGFTIATLKTTLLLLRKRCQVAAPHHSRPFESRKLSKARNQMTPIFWPIHLFLLGPKKQLFGCCRCAMPPPRGFLCCHHLSHKSAVGHRFAVAHQSGHQSVNFSLFNGAFLGVPNSILFFQP